MEKYWGEYLHRKRHGFGKLLLQMVPITSECLKTIVMKEEPCIIQMVMNMLVYFPTMSCRKDVRYASGNVYSGALSGWKRHGTGRFTEASNKHAYDGQWYYNMLHGYATHFDASENILLKESTLSVIQATILNV